MVGCSCGSCTLLASCAVANGVNVELWIEPYLRVGWQSVCCRVSETRQSLDGFSESPLCRQPCIAGGSALIDKSHAWHSSLRGKLVQANVAVHSLMVSCNTQRCDPRRHMRSQTLSRHELVMSQNCTRVAMLRGASHFPHFQRWTRGGKVMGASPYGTQCLQLQNLTQPGSTYTLYNQQVATRLQVQGVGCLHSWLPSGVLLLAPD